MESNVTIRQKFLGSMLGVALGDSIGEAMFDIGEEQSDVDEYLVESFISLIPTLSYTDDTHMTIGVAESLIACQGFEGAHMAQRFISNYHDEPWRGYASGPPTVFEMIETGESWNKASAHIFPGGSFGNGAAMRVAPIGLYFWDRHAELTETVYHASRITHAHVLGIEGATLQAMAVALAVNENPTQILDKQSFISQLLSFTVQEEFYDKISKFDELLENPDDKKNVIAQLGHGVEAFNSVPVAIFAFLANCQSFASTIAYAVSLGGDTDTITSMAGAISGAYLGINAIPVGWYRTLENREYLLSLARKL